MKGIPILAFALMMFHGDALAAQGLYSLQQGVRIRVQPNEGSSAVGSLVGVSNDSLGMVLEQTRSLQRSFPIAAIRSVDVSRGRRRGYGAAVGAFAGLALGVAIGGTVSAFTCHDSFFCYTRSQAAAFGALMGGIPGILVGSIYGAARGQDNWERVELTQH